jgi:hypothetical protein
MLARIGLSGKAEHPAIKSIKSIKNAKNKVPKRLESQSIRAQAAPDCIASASGCAKV